MKKQRQSKILTIIDEYNIETQEELVDSLEKAGFKVTQATISRDIRELSLTKVSFSGDKQKYAVLKNNENSISEKVIKVFKAGFLSVDIAQNILVVKTLPGMGQAVASAIDAFNYSNIVGTIAGDDTIFCAIKNTNEANFIIKKFNKILQMI
ncbi:arginine repressor [Candidatus Epulonipiscioides gigas]|nr:arginine repressor [Epulopiscium sp. SCG-C07WGA-EpuloA2]